MNGFWSGYRGVIFKIGGQMKYGPELRKESIYSHENNQVSRICHESPSKVSEINESTCFSSTLSLCRKFAAKTICRTLPRWEGVASSSSEIWLQEVLQKLEELWMRKGVLFSKWMESCCRGVTSRILQKKLPFWTNQDKQSRHFINFSWC